MYRNKWTLGLAALGCISLPAAANAEEKTNPLWTALSSTTISGYVNTSIHWNLGTGNRTVPGSIYNIPEKQDGFNLNVVDLTIEQPMDEAQWAAGYKVQLWFGPDATIYGTTLDSGGDSSSAAVKQAYVALRAPLGNGLDFKVGVFDGLLGYESHDAGSNPNYTRAYGVTLAPQSHTGVQMSYQFSPLVSASVAIANTVGPVINEKANTASGGVKAESYKAYTGAIALTAPDEWGFIGGSTLYAGVLNGYAAGSGTTVTNGNWDQTTWYAGATLNTPVQSLKIGASYSYLGTSDNPSLNGDSEYANAAALYVSFQASEKLSLHARGEYVWTGTGLYGTLSPAGISNGNSEVFALTGTLQYDLWRNVLSRLEVRWDHLAGDGEMVGYGGEPGPPGGGGGDPAPGTKRNSVLIAANIIYLF